MTSPDRDDDTSSDVKTEFVMFNMDRCTAIDEMYKIEEEHMLDETFRISVSGFSYVEAGNKITYVLMYVPDMELDDRMYRDVKQKNLQTELKKTYENIMRDVTENTIGVLDRVVKAYQEYWEKSLMRIENHEPFNVFLPSECITILRNGKQKQELINFNGYMTIVLKDSEAALNIANYDEDDNGKTYILENIFYTDTIFKLAKEIIKHMTW